jgi:hypothetical protein
VTTPTDEPALIAAAVAGGGDALDALIARYQDRVYRFGRRLCGDPEAARDVTQETLATMAGQLASFRGDASLSSWLFAIARSHCHKQRRRRAGAPPPGGTVDLDRRAVVASSRGGGRGPRLRGDGTPPRGLPALPRHLCGAAPDPGVVPGDAGARAARRSGRGPRGGPRARRSLTAVARSIPRILCRRPSSYS